MQVSRLSKFVRGLKLTLAFYVSDCYFEWELIRCPSFDPIMNLCCTASPSPPDRYESPNSSLRLDLDIDVQVDVALLYKKESYPITRLTANETCTEIVASKMVHSRESNQTAQTSSGLTATETAFGASLGTMVIMASIVIAYMWAKLISQRKQLRRGQLELDAMRGSKPSESGSGRTGDGETAHHQEASA